MTAHWGIEDPAAVDGSDFDKERAFLNAFNEMKMRVSTFVDLPIDTLDPLELKNKLRAIGEQKV